MSRVQSCTTLVCFHCVASAVPGCSRCEDGVDWTHVAACAECRATMAEVGR